MMKSIFLAIGILLPNATAFSKESISTCANDVLKETSSSSQGTLVAGLFGCSNQKTRNDYCVGDGMSYCDCKDPKAGKTIRTLVPRGDCDTTKCTETSVDPDYSNSPNPPTPEQEMADLRTARCAAAETNLGDRQPAPCARGCVQQGLIQTTETWTNTDAVGWECCVQRVRVCVKPTKPAPAPTNAVPIKTLSPATKPFIDK